MFNSLSRIFLGRPYHRAVAGPPGPQGPAGRDCKDLAPTLTFTRVESAPEDHPLPTYAHGQDAALDLYAVAGHVIRPGHTVVVPVGVALQDGLPAGWVGLVCSRSGLAARHSVHVLNAPGVIDPGYTGELQVILHNSGQSTYLIQPGERVAQFLTVPAVTGQADTSHRGQDGLGSTGSVQETPAPAADPAPEADPVSRPAHYTDHPVYRGQAWDYTRRLSFGRGNAFKYAWRHAGKGVPLQDLRKAEWYLENTSARDWAPAPRRLDWERAGQSSLRSQFRTFRQSMGTVSPVVARYWDPGSQTPAQRPRAALRGADAPTICLLAAMEAYQACYHILSPTRGKGPALACVRRAIYLLELLDPEDRVAPGALAQ